MNGGGGWWGGPFGAFPPPLFLFPFLFMVTRMVDIVLVTLCAVVLYYLILFTEFFAIWLLTV